MGWKLWNESWIKKKFSFPHYLLWLYIGDIIEITSIGIYDFLPTIGQVIYAFFEKISLGLL